MNASVHYPGSDSVWRRRAAVESPARRRFHFGLSAALDTWIDVIAPCPWEAHVGRNPMNRPQGAAASRAEQVTITRPRRAPLYTPQERARRDASPWTLVQGVLAPLQFLVFAISTVLVARYLLTGEGYGLATASILLKTFLLFTIMITGSIWEKAVFGRWLFAPAFFWEDVFSFLVMTLQGAYVVALVFSLGEPRQRMLIALAAYAAYVVNATQFVLKLRAARLEAAAVAAGAAG